MNTNAAKPPHVEHYANKAKIVERRASSSNLRSPKLPTLYEESSEGSEAFEGQASVLPRPKQYTVRETSSLKFLKQQLETAKGSKDKEPVKTDSLNLVQKVKAQAPNTSKLQKNIEKELLALNAKERKKKRAEVLAQILANNMAEDELERLERIQTLEQTIAREEKKEKDLNINMKKNAEAHVLLRRSLWNLRDILQHVDHRSEVMSELYKNSYLKLPLLQFQLLKMRAEPPESNGQTVEQIMSDVTSKVKQLVQEVKGKLTESELQEYVDMYQQIFTESLEMTALKKEVPASKKDEDPTKAGELHGILGRRHVKARSVRIVEHTAKKVDKRGE